MYYAWCAQLNKRSASTLNNSIVLKRARGWVQLLLLLQTNSLSLSLALKYTFDDAEARCGVIVCAFELLICVLLDRVRLIKVFALDGGLCNYCYDTQI